MEPVSYLEARNSDAVAQKPETETPGILGVQQPPLHGQGNRTNARQNFESVLLVTENPIYFPQETIEVNQSRDKEAHKLKEYGWKKHAFRCT